MKTVVEGKLRFTKVKAKIGFYKNGKFIGETVTLTKVVRLKATPQERRIAQRRRKEMEKALQNFRKFMAQEAERLALTYRLRHR